MKKYCKDCIYFKRAKIANKTKNFGICKSEKNEKLILDYHRMCQHFLQK